MFNKLLLPLHKALLKRASAQHQAGPDASSTANLARALVRAGREDEAFTIITSARKSSPSDPDIKVAYDFVRRRHARALLTQAIKQLRHDKTPRNYIRTADLLRTAGNHQKALSLMDEVQYAFPDHWGVELSMGRLYFTRFEATGDPAALTQCITHTERAIELNPDHYKSTFFLALTHVRVGMYADAHPLVESLLATFPSDPRSLALKAHVDHAMSTKESEEQGEPSDQKESETHEAAPPTNEDALRAKQMIEESAAKPEILGVFVFDSAGGLLDSKIRESDSFDFNSCTEPVGYMANGCISDANRLGIGTLESCILTGDQWQIIIRNLGSLKVVAFVDGEEGVADLDNVALELTA